MNVPVSLPDPMTFPDRACADVDPDVFFPERPAGPGPALELCAGCPRLAECAEWARPRVLARLLKDCVIGGVYVPHFYANAARRERAVAELADVAVRARAEQIDLEGAA